MSNAAPDPEIPILMVTSRSDELLDFIEREQRPGVSPYKLVGFEMGAPEWPGCEAARIAGPGFEEGLPFPVPKNETRDVWSRRWVLGLNEAWRQGRASVGGTTTMPDPTIYTRAEWLAEGKRRFGEDFHAWRFQCPVCKNVAAVADYRKYSDQGATMNSATCECIGRYEEDARRPVYRPFGQNEPGTPQQPCDYAGYGLLRLSPVRVVDSDGHETHCFAFAEVEEKAPGDEAAA